MEKTKKTLKQRSLKLKLKAAEIERAALILVENESGDNFEVHVTGNGKIISQMMVKAVKNHPVISDIFNTAALAISVDKLNDLLKNNNPFSKKAESVL